MKWAVSVLASTPWLFSVAYTAAESFLFPKVIFQFSRCFLMVQDVKMWLLWSFEVVYIKLSLFFLCRIVQVWLKWLWFSIPCHLNITSSHSSGWSLPLDFIWKQLRTIWLASVSYVLWRAVLLPFFFFPFRIKFILHFIHCFFLTSQKFKSLQ